MFGSKEASAYLRTLVVEERAYLAPIEAEIAALRQDLHDDRVVRYIYLQKKQEASQQIITWLTEFADGLQDVNNQPDNEEV